MRDVLPPQVFNRIAEHLREGCGEAEQGWESAQEDEDTITGDCFSSLRTGWPRTFDGEGRLWKWKFSYKKFRGRGGGAPEHILGADGIIQIDFEDTETGRILNKGLLFQAKKYNNRDHSELHSQARKMERLIPGASAVFEYGPDHYRAFESATVMEHEGNLGVMPSSPDHRLGNFLAERFLPCEVGVQGFYYEPWSRTLVVPNSTSGVIRYRARLKHRLRIEVRKF